MRFMMIVKASRESEAGAMPEAGLLEAMGRFNQQMADAGVMLAGEGLHASAKGARVTFSGGETSVQQGPFGLDGLVAGFWIIRAASLEEAIGWARRAPAPHGDAAPAEIEVRQIFEIEDFGEAASPELREQEERMRAKVGG